MLSTRTVRLSSFLLLGLALLGTRTEAQIFSNNLTDVPTSGEANNSKSENVDFGDVDLDGDWDAVFADGGDGGNDQNRLWLNLGGLQGGTIGTFDDFTSTRLPSVSDDSRDVEFADVDNDGDLDLYVSNTAQIQNQSNRWWINQGGLQAGSPGFYVDDTPARWINLGVGGPGGSSVAPGLVLGTGGFIDWSCDCDFGDLDNDGDLDLVHSTYGSNFGGFVPTRLFLNDGSGFFEEFNPSGHQLVIATMQANDPALWCEGVFHVDTNDSTGLQADICTNTLDVDVGDTDGDFDLDILHGDRDSNPRFFFNRLEETGGTLGFRDVSFAVLGPDDWAAAGNYEQEMGDLDGDGDLDLYGLNWSLPGTSDVLRENDGTGVFLAQEIMEGSIADDNEGDFLDIDNDGDIDMYIANFQGTDKVYRNNGGGPGGFELELLSQEESGIPTLSGGNDEATDADAADVDKDGDYDVFVSTDFASNQNLYFENVTQVPDVHPPYIPNVEQVAGPVTASPDPIAVRAQVYDNAPYYITWYNPTVLEVTVDGCRLPDLPMRSSGGQIFRAELPGNLVGEVSYRVRSSDEYGNQGVSATSSYTASTPLEVGGPFGIGGAAGSEPEPGLRALSVAFPSTSLYLGIDGMNPGSIAVLAVGLAPEAPPITAFPSFTPAINVAGVTLVLAELADADGCSTWEFPLSATIPSASIYFQAFTTDLPDFSEPWAASAGLEVVLDPS